MNGEPSGLSELERAIARFEQATARHHQQAPATARSLRVSRPRWRPALAIAAAVLSTNLLAAFPTVRDSPESATDVRSLVAPPAPVRRVTRAPRSHVRINTGPVMPSPEPASLSAVEVPTTIERPSVPLANAAPIGDADATARRSSAAPVDPAPEITTTSEEDLPETAAEDLELVSVPAIDSPCAPPSLGGRATAASTADTPLARLSALSRSGLPYRGVMTTPTGVPLVGRFSTIFALYQTPDGGVPLWVDIKTVETSDTGAYIVWLGQPTPFPADLLASGPAPWLGIQPEGQPEQPRVRVTDEPCGSPAPVAPLPTMPPPPPPLIPYRGTLQDSAGAPIVGPISAIFAFYEEPAGGLPLWVDIQTVHAGAAGGYTILLGGGTELPVGLLTTGTSRWLGVQADGHAEGTRVEFQAQSPVPR